MTMRVAGIGLASLVAAATCVTMASVSCSPASGASDSPGGPSGSGGAGGVLFGSGSTSGGGFGNVTGTGSDTGVGGDGSCHSEVHQGERSPLDMYFIVDKSGSMKESVQGGTKWSVVTGALIAFLQDPANSTIGTGIEFFPSIDPNAPTSCQTTADCTTAAGNYGTCEGLVIPFIGCLGCFCSLADSCQTGAYLPAVPLQLPPNPGAVVASIGTMGPGGGTPTRPALEGGMAYAQQWAAGHPGRATVIVLATDGDPTGCQTNAVSASANIAAAGLTNGIRTFVIGVGSSLGSLNQIAAAGGTTSAFVLDTGGNVAQAFADALAAIYGQAASCDFSVPKTTDNGSQIDLNSVNAQFTLNGSSTDLFRTASGGPDTCGDNQWYFDDPAAPTVIRLCPTTCDALKAGGIVNVELGCQPTRVKPR